MIQRLRVPLGFVIAAVVLYLATPRGITILAGLPFAVAGALLRAMAAGIIRKDSKLATAGPYAWTRNPLYFGSFLLTLGFAIMSASWIAALILIIPSLVIYPNVIRNEEAHLERLFPEDFRRLSRPRSPLLSKVRAIRTVLFIQTVPGESRIQHRARICCGIGGVHPQVAVKWRLI